MKEIAKIAFALVISTLELPNKLNTVYITDIE